MRTANKVVFFDTDAVVTDYYSELYMGHRNHLVEAFINPDKYDVLLYLQPDVRWVADGQRLNGDQERREMLDRRLQDMYREFGFGEKMVLVGGDYRARLSSAIGLVDNLLQLREK
jgi:HTH-type transcriptional repressor of NAD biosynthesis genes